MLQSLQQADLFIPFLRSFLGEYPTVSTPEELLLNVETYNEMMHLLDIADLQEIEKFSSTSVSLYVANFYRHSKETKRSVKTQCLDHIHYQANEIIRQKKTNQDVASQTRNDCLILSSELHKVAASIESNALKEKIDALILCVSSMHGSSSELESFMKLMNEVSCQVLASQQKKEESLMLVTSMKEQMQVMYSRFQRELQREKNEKILAQERLALVQEQLTSQHQKNEELLFLVRDMGKALEAVEKERYREEIQYSILDTLVQQQDMINGQEHAFANSEDTKPVCVTELLQEIENLSYDSDECDNECNLQSMLTVQHFGYLHEVINSQQSKIKELTERRCSEGPLHADLSVPPNSQDTAHTSLTKYIEQLKLDIEQHNQHLGLEVKKKK